MKQYTGVQAIREFFGLRPGEDLQGFMAEIKALTPDDKKELAADAARELGGELK